MLKTWNGIKQVINIDNKPLGTNESPEKNDSEKTQDIRMSYVGNGYV